MHLTSEIQPRQTSPKSKRNKLNQRIPRMGRVVFADHANAVHCTVKGFSSHGATLTMTGWLGLPSEFILYVEPDNIRADCKVKMRKGSNVEVSFLDVEEGVRFSSRL